MSLGTDINTPITDGVPDLDPMFGLVSGRLALAQAIARRLTTRRGLLEWINDDPEYGHDVREYLGEDVGPRAEFVIASRVQAECLKDERVRAAQVTATLTSGRLTLSIKLTDADGPFRLTLAVTGVTVELLKVY
jgi:phage baseplate assembly protein W